MLKIFLMTWENAHNVITCILKIKIDYQTFQQYEMTCRKENKKVHTYNLNFITTNVAFKSNLTSTSVKQQ